MYIIVPISAGIWRSNITFGFLYKLRTYIVLALAVYNNNSEEALCSCEYVCLLFGQVVTNKTRFHYTNDVFVASIIWRRTAPFGKECCFSTSLAQIFLDKTKSSKISHVATKSSVDKK